MKPSEDFIEYLERWMGIPDESTMNYSEVVTLITNNAPPRLRYMLCTAWCNTYTDFSLEGLN